MCTVGRDSAITELHWLSLLFNTRTQYLPTELGTDRNPTTGETKVEPVMFITSANLHPVSRRYTVAPAKLADNEMHYWSTHQMFA